MNRHYYISDNLDELERVEQELEAQGISTEQIHVLSERDAEVEQHQLHDVPSFMKQDVVHSGGIGALVGLALAAVLLLGAYWLGWTASVVGWMPFIFLAVVLFGFCVWEGGFFGIQTPNAHFRRFRQSLQDGKHVFFVDVAAEQEPLLAGVLRQHPGLSAAGTGEATPYWLMLCQQKWRQFRRAL
ncbi:magnesium transporter [Pseudomonas sp. SP16.1]|uniref:magnesium transporter n=1 Tax=Pseudomonas sp. SP16.1 TaxID=3458854 RepID=UPI0040467570